jgi:hypothetical protein
MYLALSILANILIFSATTFVTSIVIEKYYHGRLKWILVPSVTALLAILLIETDLILRVLHSLTNNLTIQDIALIILGGMMTGIFFSFL